MADGTWPNAMASFRAAISLFDEVRHRENRGWVLGPMALAAQRSASWSSGGSDAALPRRCLAEALDIGLGLHTFMPLVYGLPAAALILADEGDVEQALEVYAAVADQGFVAASRWFADVIAAPLTAAAAGLPNAVVTAAESRGRSETLESMAERLAGPLSRGDCLYFARDGRSAQTLPRRGQTCPVLLFEAGLLSRESHAGR